MSKSKVLAGSTLAECDACRYTGNPQCQASCGETINQTYCWEGDVATSICPSGIGCYCWTRCCTDCDEDGPQCSESVGGPDTPPPDAPCPVANRIVYNCASYEDKHFPAYPGMINPPAGLVVESNPPSTEFWFKQNYRNNPIIIKMCPLKPGVEAGNYNLTEVFLKSPGSSTYQQIRGALSSNYYVSVHWIENLNGGSGLYTWYIIANLDSKKASTACRSDKKIFYVGSPQVVFHGYIWENTPAGGGAGFDSCATELWTGGTTGASCADASRRDALITLTQNGTNALAGWYEEFTLNMFHTKPLPLIFDYPMTLTLTPPAGYTCDYWEYYPKDYDGVYVLAERETGTGCNATITPPYGTGLYNNRLLWRIARTNTPPTCNISIVGSVPNPDYKLNVSTSTTLMVNVTDPDGGASPSYNVSWVGPGTFLSPSVVNPMNPYEIRTSWTTPSSPQSGVTLQATVTDTVNGNSGTCSINNITIENRPIVSDAWVSVLDGDIFTQEIDRSFPYDDAIVFANDFENTLIQLSPNHQAYVFTKNENYSTDSIVSETDSGYAKQISSSDVYVNKYLYSPTSNLTTLNFSNWNSLENGKAYVVDSDDLSIDNPTTYQVSGGGISVIYVKYDGSNSFEINSSLISGSGKVIIVTDAPVDISTSVGKSDGYATYTKSSLAQIDAVIISSKDITVQSVDPGDDIPLIVNGSLISKGNVFFDRNLGDYYNMFPAQYVKYDQTAFYKLFKIEKNLNQTFLTKTGVSGYDTQWIYGN